jgi:hypothetical protein
MSNRPKGVLQWFDAIVAAIGIIVAPLAFGLFFCFGTMGLAENLSFFVS